MQRTELWLAIAGLCLANSLRADELLGFYLGAEAYWAHGYSDVPLGIPAADLQNRFIPNRLDESHKSATPVIGFRPITLLGAEIKYVDFGRRESFLVSNEERYYLQAGSKAIALFGMLYAPLPVRFIDFYGKAGVAQVKSTFIGNAILMTPGLAPPYYLSWAANVNRTEVRFAYGGGAQVKLSSLALRAEYERLQQSAASAGNPPYIFSLGATWTF